VRTKETAIGVLLGQRGDAHRNPRQVDPLVFAQQAAVDDLADHVVALHLVDAQLDQPVGEQNARALFDVFRQGFEGGSHQRGRARNLARRNRQPPAGLEQHGLVILQL
jgi:aminoglycoside phosphotransferase (APT) family kinase protein